MRTMEIGHAAKPVGENRISKLDDAVLAHVLSFLPSKQGARAAALSSGWRDVFAYVHTVSFEEPECGYDGDAVPDNVGRHGLVPRHAVARVVHRRHLWREVSATEELTRLTTFLDHFPSTKHLRLTSKRLCPAIGADDAITRIPMFANLQHLELWGQLPLDTDTTAIVGTTSRILRQASNLQVLSFVFETGTWTDIEDDGPLARGRYDRTDRELLEAHRLSYNQYSSLHAPNGGAMISCLANSVREINLVHYQQGAWRRGCCPGSCLQRFGH
ncbi:unnamed protein product [Alopecurus aequalis]